MELEMPVLQDCDAPQTRPDWRTCKLLEAISINAYHNWSKPFIYDDPWLDEVYPELIE
jgi:hypothetical protein